MTRARADTPAAPAPDGVGVRLAGMVARFEAGVARHPGWVAGGLYLFALLLRLYHLAEYRHTLMARVFLMDEAYYHAEAWNLIRGVPPATDSWFMNPLYPYFLSLVFRVVGDDPVRAYLVQLVLGALVAPLAFAVARRVVRPALAVVAALAVATCAPLVFFESLFLVEWLIVVALLGALACIVPARRSRLAAAGCGALLGVATLARGSNLLLAVPLVWHLARHGRRPALAAALGLLAVLSPLLVYNATHARQPLLLTANGGFNLYLGNGPGATGLFTLPPGLDLAQDPLALRWVQRETGKQVTASEASRFWWQRTVEHVRQHPGTTLRLFGRKLAMFWNRFSFPQVEGFATATRGWRLSRWPFWSGVVAFPLGLAGMLWVLLTAGRRGGPAGDRGMRVLLALVALLYGVSIAVFFVTDRYRAGVLPVLVLLGAMVVEGVLAATRPERRRGLLVWGAALAAAFVVTSPGWLRIDMRRVQRDLLVHEALRFAKAGRFDDALQLYVAAADLAPEDPDVLDGLARMQARAGQDSLAIATLRHVVETHPSDARAWYNLGNVQRRAGHLEDAVRSYRKALMLDPKREAAWNNLGEAYRALGEPARAAAAYRRALDIVPGHAQALNNLAALYASQGDGERAERGFRDAIAADPRYVPAWTNLAILLTNTGRYEEALEAWRTIARIDPDNTLARETLRRIEAARQGAGTPGNGDAPQPPRAPRDTEPETSPPEGRP